MLFSFHEFVAQWICIVYEFGNNKSNNMYIIMFEQK